MIETLNFEERLLNSIIDNCCELLVLPTFIALNRNDKSVYSQQSSWKLNNLKSNKFELTTNNFEFKFIIPFFFAGVDSHDEEVMLSYEEIIYQLIDTEFKLPADIFIVVENTFSVNQIERQIKLLSVTIMDDDNNYQNRLQSWPNQSFSKHKIEVTQTEINYEI